MCWRGDDRYFEAVLVDDSPPNSSLKGEVKSMSEEEIVEGAAWGGDSFLGQTL